MPPATDSRYVQTLRARELFSEENLLKANENQENNGSRRYGQSPVNEREMLRKVENGTFNGEIFKKTLTSWNQLFVKESKLNICGDKWKDRYENMHEDILESRRERRFLIYSCRGRGHGCGGYGNRLNAITSLFLLAVLTDRAFMIDWSSGIAMELFWKPKNINWNYPLANLKELESCQHYWGKGTPKNVGKDVLRPADNVQSFLEWMREVNIPTYFNHSVEIITSVWYLVDMFWENPYLVERASELGIHRERLKYSFLGCATDFLFQKTPDLVEQLNKAKSSLGISWPGKDLVVGLHIRIGDVAFGFKHRATRNYQDFFECARKAENRILEVIPEIKRGSIRWFLATDDARVKSYASQKYANKVVSLDIVPQHIDKYGRHTATSQGMLGVLLDHFLLSECVVLVLSQSTFGLTAQALTFHSPVMYTYGENCTF